MLQYPKQVNMKEMKFLGQNFKISQLNHAWVSVYTVLTYYHMDKVFLRDSVMKCRWLWFIKLWWGVSGATKYSTIITNIHFYIICCRWDSIPSQYFSQIFCSVVYSFLKKTIKGCVKIVSIFLLNLYQCIMANIW